MKKEVRTVAPNSEDVERVCAFMDGHCGEHIRLDELCRVGHMSKSALLRSFVKYKHRTDIFNRCVSTAQRSCWSKALRLLRRRI